MGRCEWRGGNGSVQTRLGGHRQNRGGGGGGGVTIYHRGSDLPMINGWMNFLDMLRVQKII